MDFKQVEAFVFVAKYKSFSRAAEKLLLSQPTVSTHINTLEDNLGVKLFDRLSREVLLTEAGQLFYPYAVDMMDLRERSQESVKEFLNEVSGNLRIGTSTIIAEYILPQVIKNFKNIYKKTYFNFSVNNSQTVIQRIADGILDIALVARKIPKKDLDYKLFLKDKIVLAVYPEHPLYKRQNLFLEEILNEDFIIREIGSGTRAAVENSFKQKGYDFDSLNSAAMFSTTHSVIQAVKCGLGLAFASETALRNKSCAAELKGIPITDLVVEKDIYVVYNKKKNNKKLLKQFLSTLMSYEV